LSGGKSTRGIATKRFSVDFKYHLFSSFAANLVLPVFYLYLPLLASRLGASVLEIGLVGGASNAVYSFMPFIMGRYSDRQGARKFFIASSFAILTTVSFLYVVVASPVSLILLRLLEGIGWAMLWPAVEAAISNDASVDSRWSLSVFNLTWSAASAVGPLFGSVLIFLVSIRFAFLSTSVILLGVLALNVYAIFAPRDRSRVKPHEQFLQRPEQPATESKITVGFYMISTALGAVSSGVLFTFFVPYAGTVGISILAIGVITFVYGFVRFLVYVLIMNRNLRHSLLNPVGRLRKMLVTLAVMSLSSVLFMFHDSTGVLYTLAYAIVGGGYSIIYAVSQVALVWEKARPERAGRGAGLFESSIGIGASLGPIVAGAVSGGSLTTPFLVPALSFLIVLVALPLAVRKSKVLP
jgi:MFS transporter, DHA1 family, multidrug resistance protein